METPKTNEMRRLENDRDQSEVKVWGSTIDRFSHRVCKRKCHQSEMVLISRYKGKLAEYGMQTDKNQRLKTEVKKLH